MLVTFVVLVGSAVLLGTLNSAAKNRVDDIRQTAAALAEAKAALTGWAVGHPNLPGMMPWPDRNGDGNYDGQSDCATVAFNPSFLLGQLPWLKQSAPCVEPRTGLGVDIRDGAGEHLWIAVSRNLIREYSPPSDPIINSNLVNTPPYPWITVRDANANVISNRVAAVIISPGATLGSQDRGSGVAGAANYLDSVTIGPKTYSNADADDDFISYPNSDRTPDPNDEFNDSLVFITIDELMPLIERRVLGEVAASLEVYRSANGAYPWLVPFADPRAVSLLDRAIATAGSAGLTLVDANQDFVALGVEPGDVVRNISDGSEGMISAVLDPNTVTLASLDGGGGFTSGDQYEVRDQLTGTAGAASTGSTLVDTAKDFNALGVIVGDVVRNLTDGSRGLVTAVPGPSQLVVALVGVGAENDFDAGDSYVISRFNWDQSPGTRKGLVPFHEAGEAFNSSFVLDWNIPEANGADVSVSPAGLAPNYATMLREWVQSSAYSGKSMQVAVADGVCVWNTRSSVDCHGSAAFDSTPFLSGTATAGSTGLILEDDTRDFGAMGVFRGAKVENITDATTGVVNSVGTTTLTAAVVGVFDVGDTYRVHIPTRIRTGLATSGSDDETLEDDVNNQFGSVRAGDTVVVKKTKGSVGSVGIVIGFPSADTLDVASLDGGASDKFHDGDEYEIYSDFVDQRSYEVQVRYAGLSTVGSTNGVRTRNVCTHAGCVWSTPDFDLPAQPGIPSITIVDVDSTSTELARATVTIPSAGAQGALKLVGLNYELEQGVDLPAWFVANDWHQFIYVSVSEGLTPGGANVCISGGTPDCLTLSGAAVPNNDKFALVIAAGGELAGQNRAATGSVDEYLEGENDESVANDTYQRGRVTAVFNDQVRVVAQ